MGKVKNLGAWPSKLRTCPHAQPSTMYIAALRHACRCPDRRMSLLKFFKPSNSSLPKPEGRLATVPSSSIAAANREVKKVLCR